MSTPGGTNEAGPADDPEVFALAEDPPRPRGRATTAHPAPLAAVPVLPPGATPTLGYAPNLDARAFAAAPEFASRLHDLWVPAGLVAAAAGLGMAVAVAVTDLHTALLAVSTYAVVKAVVVTVAVFALTRFAGVAFGRYEQAVLKLAAVALLPDAIVAATFGFAGICPGTLLGIPVAITSAYLIFTRLFDQDGPEAIASTAVLLLATAGPWVLWYRIFSRVLEIAG